MVGHFPVEFPSDCISAILEGIRNKDLKSVIHHVWFLIGWALGRAFPEEGFGAVELTEEDIAQLSALNSVLRSELGRPAEDEALEGPIVDMMIRQAIMMLLEYIQGKGGENLIKIILDILQKK